MNTDIYHISAHDGEHHAFFANRKDALKELEKYGDEQWSITRYTLPVSKGGLMTALALAGQLGGSEVSVYTKLVSSGEDFSNYYGVARAWERETEHYEDLVDEGEINANS